MWNRCFWRPRPGLSRPPNFIHTYLSTPIKGCDWVNHEKFYLSLAGCLPNQRDHYFFGSTLIWILRPRLFWRGTENLNAKMKNLPIAPEFYYFWAFFYKGGRIAVDKICRLDKNGRGREKQRFRLVCVGRGFCGQKKNGEAKKKNAQNFALQKKGNFLIDRPFSHFRKIVWSTFQIDQWQVRGVEHFPKWRVPTKYLRYKGHKQL